MRYIEKIAIKDVDKHTDIKPLLNYINAERNPVNSLNPPRHPSFSGMKSDKSSAVRVDKKDTTQFLLLRQLLKEQFGLCCFCQERVTTKYLIEHLLPQSIFKNEEVDYYNLFLCCQTQGQCSDYKKEYLIGKFITHSKCESFFKYNWNGEILPNCSYALWQSTNGKSCNENLDKLNVIELQAFVTIQVLGLNRQPLISRRLNKLQANDFIGELKRNKSNLSWLKAEQAKYTPQPTINSLPEYSSMFLYFINDMIERNHGKQHV
jgi:uncharacterized protein (TIGR02646 family)